MSKLWVCVSKISRPLSNCGQWNSMVEEVIQDTSDRRARVSLTGKKTQPQRLSEVVPKKSRV